ncbi:DUF1493 family protein [bacterium]|nr:DUF1493 family protein [bacterium]
MISDRLKEFLNFYCSKYNRKLPYGINNIKQSDRISEDLHIWDLDFDEFIFYFIDYFDIDQNSFVAVRDKYFKSGSEVVDFILALIHGPKETKPFTIEVLEKAIENKRFEST